MSLAMQAGGGMPAGRISGVVGAALERCPLTAQALAAGTLSPAQAKEIVSAERVRPGCERDLLGVAASGGLRRLRDAALAKRVEAQT